MSVSLVNSNVPLLMERDLSKAEPIKYEVFFVAFLVDRAFSIAVELSENISLLSREQMLKPCKIKKISFQLSNEFFLKIFPACVRDFSLTVQGLGPISCGRLKAFIEVYKLPLEYSSFSNPHVVQQPPQWRGMATFLQIAYRQHNDWFQKINLPQEEQKLSCFDFSIKKSGVDFLKFNRFLLGVSVVKKISFEDYVSFLQLNRFYFSKPPVKEGDIVVYYNEKNQILHAVLAKSGVQVYAKFGDSIPFAYIHDLDETPSEYGTYYAILRQKLPY